MRSKKYRCLIVFKETFKGAVASKLGQSRSLSAHHCLACIITPEFDDDKQFDVMKVFFEVLFSHL